MKLEDIIKNLDEMFIKRYDKLFVELNKNVYIMPEENGIFDVPVVTLGTGGGTLANTIDAAFELQKPAYVKLQSKKMIGAQAIYRIAVPFNECEIAANKPEYFNFLFDKITYQAIANYNKTFKGPDVVRFGKVYATYKHPMNNSIFKDLDGGDHLELRIFGKWASDEEATSQG